MNDTVNPVFVEVTRGDIVETRHRGSLAVIDYEGKLLGAWGDIDEKVFLRSACKPMQAIQLIESGAADEYSLTEQEITLGCSSHYTEEIHETVVTNWLNRIGLSLDMLECGPPTPDCLNNLVLKRRGISVALPVHNNCSGKHANFLTVSKFLGFPLKNYIDEQHPIQQLVKKTLGEMTEADIENSPVAIEGCGVPAYAFSRREGALGYAKFSNPKVLPKKRADACRRIMKAMMNNPDHFGGNGCWDSTSTRILNGVICKEGNRGTQIAMIPAMGLGVVVKIEDGQGFAKECAMGAVLTALGLINEEQQHKLKDFLAPDVKNGIGEIVGTTRPNSKWFEELKDSLSSIKKIDNWYENI